MLPLLILSVFVGAISSLLFPSSRRGALPLVNGTRWSEPAFIRQIFFLFFPGNTVVRARRYNSARPFRLLNYSGETWVLPARCADIVRNDRNLSLGKYLAKEFLTHLPGHSPVDQLRNPALIVKIINRFTRATGESSFQKALSQYAASYVDRSLGKDETLWRKICLYDFVLDVNAGVDIKAFWGDRLVNSPDWHLLTKTYLPDTIGSVITLRIVPRFFRTLAQYLSPHYRRMQRSAAQAARILQPIIEERRSSKIKYNDALTWAEEESSTKNYDIPGIHLALAASIPHTSADLLTQVLIQLAQEPSSSIQLLREEIIRAYTTHGLSRDAFKSMHLLDSCLKESARIKPASNFSLHRISPTPTYLPAYNLTIPAGESIVVDMSTSSDPAIFPDPHVFKLDRFLRLRDHDDWGTKALFSSPSASHLYFGYGYQACPGRFYVDLKLKLLLSHLLLSYDWKLAPGTSVKPKSFGPMMVANPSCEVLYKRRQAEMDISCLWDPS